MKMKKIFRSILAFCLAALIAATTFVPVMAKDDITSFSDVKEGAWYYDAVTYVAGKGIMVGMKENTFGPNVKFTRAMAVQMLSTLSGDDLSGYAKPDFPDVSESSWFMRAVAWGVDKEIVVGIDGNFKPNDYVTREQLARMIHQFAQKYEIENIFACGPETADEFDDSGKIGAWAKENINWAVYNGIISGVGNNKLDPRGTATRAQAAQIFYYLHYMKTNGFLPVDTSDYDAITTVESENPRIMCWGDSMTAGYPKHLRTLAKTITRNYSENGEIAEYIAMKQGAIPFYVEPFTLPASKEPTRVELLGEDFTDLGPIGFNGNNGLSPVYINGVVGNLYFSKDDDCHYFVRQDPTPLKEIEISRVTRVVTRAMSDRQTSDIHVIFSGPSNEYSYDEAHKLIEVQQRMIDHLGTDRYIIISLTSLYYMPQIWEFNEDLAEYHGEHFLDFRSYAIEHGLEDMGIVPTEADLENIAKGEIPASLLSDYEHGNEYFNILLAQQVYKRLLELGYLEAE